MAKLVSTQFSGKPFVDGKTEVSVKEIVAIARKMRGQPASQIAQFYAQVKRLVAEAEAELKPLKDLQNKLATVTLPEAFEMEQISTFTAKDGSRVSVAQVVRASIKEGKQDEAVAWFKDNGMEDVPQVTVNSSTLAATARRVLQGEGVEAGEDKVVYDLPSAIFEVSLMPQVSVTKGKAKP